MENLCSSLILMCILISPPLCRACGVSTHISIAHEASFFLNSKSQYSQIIKSNQDAFVAGNPYPDFAYAKECFDYKYHEVSETTHWAPFLNATINYIRRTYKRPWNQVSVPRCISQTLYIMSTPCLHMNKVKTLLANIYGLTANGIRKAIQDVI